MCTDFMLNKIAVSGRTFDWHLVTPDEKNPTRISKTPKGSQLSSRSSRKSTDPASWESQYGYVAVEAKADGKHYGMVDGLNEAGLSIGVLWLPGSTYQEDGNLSILDLGLWILSKYQSVEEVKSLEDDFQEEIHIWGPQGQHRPTVHFTIHDRNGQNLVIEFIDKEMLLYENSQGVLTNYPPFPDQIENLATYQQSIYHQTQGLTNQNLIKHLNGSGLLGLPGDATPPSRFVRSYFLKEFSQQINPSNEEKDAIQQALHILNNVDVCPGEVADGDDLLADYTMWSVVRDHANLMYYFRTTQNLTLRRFDLQAMGLDSGEVKIYKDIEECIWFIDKSSYLTD